MNWVEQKWQQEKFIAENAERLWRDLCNALKDAVKSYNNHYGGNAATDDESRADQFRVTVNRKDQSTKPSIIDIDFAANQINVVCRSGSCRSMKIQLNADQNHPYRIKQEPPITVEQASEEILKLAFFDQSEFRVTVI